MTDVTSENVVCQQESADTELCISPYFSEETIGHRGKLASLIQDRVATLGLEVSIRSLRFPACFMLASAYWLPVLQVSLYTLRLTSKDLD